MQKNIKGAIHTLILQALLPEGSEGEDTLGLQVQHINEHLVLTVIHLVTVDPELERLRCTRLVDLGDELADYGHVIIDHHHIRAQLTNHIGQHREAEPLLEGPLERSGVNDAYIRRVGAIARLKLLLGELLKAEVGDRQPGVLGELLENAPRHLTVAGVLLTVSGDEKELELLLTASAYCGNTYGRNRRSRSRSVHYVFPFTDILRPLLCGSTQDQAPFLPPQTPRPSSRPILPSNSSCTPCTSPSSARGRA